MKNTITGPLSKGIRTDGGFYQVVDEGNGDKADSAQVGREADAHATDLGRVQFAGERIQDQEGGGDGELGDQIQHQRLGHRICACAVGTIEKSFAFIPKIAVGS